MRVTWDGHGVGNLNSQQLILRCGIVLIYSSLSFLSSFSSLVSLSVLWIYFWRFLFMRRFFSVFLAFGISWVATTSTNWLKYNFNCLSNQLSNITTFKIPSLKLASLFCLENFFWGRMVDREWLCFILWWW